MIFIGGPKRFIDNINVVGLSNYAFVPFIFDLLEHVLRGVVALIVSRALLCILLFRGDPVRSCGCAVEIDRDGFWPDGRISKYRTGIIPYDHRFDIILF